MDKLLTIKTNRPDVAFRLYPLYKYEKCCIHINPNYGEKTKLGKYLYVLSLLDDKTNRILATTDLRKLKKLAKQVDSYLQTAEYLPGTILTTGAMVDLKNLLEKQIKILELTCILAYKEYIKGAKV